MSTQKMEQERAAFAWERIEEVDRMPDVKFKKEYRGLALKLPSMILTNGLGQTLAFLKSKGKNDPNRPDEAIYGHMEKWIRKNSGFHRPGTPVNGLIETVLSGSSADYRLLTVETLAFLNWLKRFADAKLPKDEVEP